MSRITIIGKGSMGNAIGGVFAAGGSDVAYVTHGDTEATVSGDTVVLAVPYPEVDGILASLGAQLTGKTVVDITNPVDFSTFDSLVVPADGSAAAEIQAKLPGSHVLKAFNTTFAATLASKQVGGVLTTVLVAGDDTDAKTALIEAILAGGLSALDAGALSRARELEALGFLQLTLAAREKIGWNGGFAVIR
ncbi:NADPH-dependent F420 reductase [Herbiconiux sp. YIM B11900]|uniref:NADPH-dependent F420 reductase n=1 Tax=Herbiconiux sp. YIM B11900 TaxID=3404131 RepID=UPI003F87698C